MNLESIKAFRRVFPNAVGPAWAHYLTFAYPPLSWDGEGKLPEIAVYDLEHQPTTYDFLCWLILVKAMGAKHVRFAYEGKIQDWKYPAAQAWKRFGMILVPLCELMGMPFDVGPRCKGFTTAYRWGHVNSYYLDSGPMDMLPHIGGENPGITITLRDTIKFKWKDSNRKVWLRFARFLESCGEKVTVLDDPDATGSILEVRKRLALYCGAKTNLGASNGTMSLCMFSPAPYLVTNLMPDSPESGELRNEFARIGFPVGSQFAFATSKQRLSWLPDTYDNVMSEYLDYWRKV